MEIINLGGSTQNEGSHMPFTAPNRYSPRTDWKEKLIYSSPPAGSWQSDLVIYWQWRRVGEELLPGWTDLRMTPINAQPR